MKRWIVIAGGLACAAVVAWRFPLGHSAHAAHLPRAGQPRIAQWHNDATAAISFTLDDGLQCHADIAAPMFHEFGLRATFYVIPGMARLHESDPAVHDPRFRFGEGAISWDEIRHIHELGMEIGNHSLTHSFFRPITDETMLNQQINYAAQLITREVGAPPETFAFPYNEWLPKQKKMVLQHHLAVRENWTDYGGPAFTTNVANGLVEKALQQHAWLVPMIHGIDCGFLPLSSTVLREHLEFVKAHADELWIDTYADVARYQAQRSSANLQVETSQPGEMIFSLAPTHVSGTAAPLTVVLPLPLNEDTDEVDAEFIDTQTAVPVTREADRILVDLTPGSSPVTVHWH